MLTNVFLGIEGGFRCGKAGSLAHVDDEFRVVGPWGSRPIGSAQREVSWRFPCWFWFTEQSPYLYSTFQCPGGCSLHFCCF